MPAARRRIRPARSMSRWLMTSASAGTSFRVVTRKREARIEGDSRSALSLLRSCRKIELDSSSQRPCRMLDRDGYRPNVGIILVNPRNEVFWGKRVNQHAWQFPQGGIKHGETPVQAMYRELEEEIGLSRAHVRILGRTRAWLRYEVPEKWTHASAHAAAGSRASYRGQKQIWFLLR